MAGVGKVMSARGSDGEESDSDSSCRIELSCAIRAAASSSSLGVLGVGGCEPDDLFNLRNVQVAVVNVVVNSGDGLDDSSVGGCVIGKWDWCEWHSVL